jgi:hypothetical protein
MMLPTEVMALAEARREAFEREIRLQAQLVQLPQRTARWRQWTGSGLMWAGARLVNWGEGVAMMDGSQRIEVVH